MVNAKEYWSLPIFMSLFHRILLLVRNPSWKRLLRRKHGFFFCSRAQQAYEPGCLDSSRGKSLESILLRPDFLSEFAKLLSQGHNQWDISIKHPAGKFLAPLSRHLLWLNTYGNGSKIWRHVCPNWFCDVWIYFGILLYFSKWRCDCGVNLLELPWQHNAVEASWLHAAH